MLIILFSVQNGPPNKDNVKEGEFDYLQQGQPHQVQVNSYNLRKCLIFL